MMTASSADAAGLLQAARGHRTAWRRHILLGSAMLLAVAAANGRPSVFPDTAWYYSQGEYLAWRLGLALPDLDENRLTDPTSVLPDSHAMRDRIPATVAGGRSPFYGLILVLAVRYGTLWLLAAMQAFLSAWAICALVRGALPEATPLLYQGIVLALGLGTSLPFFAAFAMPDIYAGLLILAVTVLALYPRRVPAPERALLWVLLVASLTFHAANIALAVTLSGLALAILAGLGTPAKVIILRAGWLALSILVALALNGAFGALYRADAGVAQRTPPFLMARLLADGPGRDYLAAFCPGGASPTLCRFIDRPFASEDEILWSDDPSKGVFTPADYRIRDSLKREEPAFAAAVALRAPLAVAGSLLRNGLHQLVTFYVLEPMKSPTRFLQFDWWRRTAILRIVPDMAACESRPEACEVRGNPVWIAIVHIVTVLAASLFVAWTMVTSRGFGLFARGRQSGSVPAPHLAGTVILVTGGVILNAVICGAVSGTFARYQARVVWMIPLLALLIAAELWRSKRVRNRQGAEALRP